jgi:catechol 2,3-dioxygenase-like lactoylglutathione lyase family enzyme
MIEKVHHIIIPVSYLKKAVSFYENILGLKKIKEWPNFAIFDVGGVQFGLALGEKVGIHLLVDDVDKAYQRLKGKGVKFVTELKDQPWGERTATFVDPDGNTFTLEQIKK